MDTLKVSVSRIVACLNKSFKACLHKSAYAAAENCLLAEEVSFSLGAECGFKNTCTSAADTESICKTDIPCVACCVLLNSDKARNTLACLILGANGVTGSLGSDHDNVYILGRLDASEMNVKAVSESKSLALGEVRLNALLVKSGLLLVIDKYHNDVCSLSCICACHYLEALSLSLCPAS